MGLTEVSQLLGKGSRQARHDSLVVLKKAEREELVSGVAVVRVRRRRRERRKMERSRVFTVGI